MTFSELGLGPEVLRAIAEAGYTQPTPIQEKAIPWVLQGRDVLGVAQTGTGKTASFTLPMIDILASGRAKARMPRSLILEPTRELAAQVAENFEKYGKYNKLNMALLIGGESFGDQIKKLERGVDVLIATPGRMMDLFDRGNILLTDTKFLVIDEADRMLDMGFIPDIERIVGLLPKIRQTLFFSATMPPEIKRLADAFLTNPREVSVAPPASPAATVTQGLVVVYDEDKRSALRQLLKTEEVKNAFIFCNRKKEVAVLHKSLEKHGFNAGALHGDLVQSKRTETLEAFKQGQIDLLVCSDVAARGIDIKGVSHVFNFDVPYNSEDYVHRIGRTGRAGLTGRAFTLAAPEDGKYIQSIEKLVGKAIPRVALDGMDSPELDYTADPRKRRKKPEGRGETRGPDRSESPSRGDRGPAPERGDRPPRGDRPHQNERGDRPAQGERSERVPQAERGDRRDRGEYRNDRRPRPEDRPHDRPTEERAARPERGPERSERPERRDYRDERRRRREEEAEDRISVIGFGDDVPAFILRAARPGRANSQDPLATEPGTEE
ncbi:MAG: hypothetical protein RLY86_878 [Pseudomonadota bacterium]|jgi:superfamily II DNA/RNA helicase